MATLEERVSNLEYRMNLIPPLCTPLDAVELEIFAKYSPRFTLEERGALAIAAHNLSLSFDASDENVKAYERIQSMLSQSDKGMNPSEPG